MKITGIDVKSVIGVRAASIFPNTPVVVFAGRNGAGKSSLHQAINMALVGNVSRVGLKKEYGLLVSDGAKAGSASVSVEIDGEAHTATFSLPSGKHQAIAQRLHPALRFVLDPAALVALEADEMRTFWFNLMGLSCAGGEAGNRLLAKGCNSEKVEAAMPSLLRGFPAAESFAKSMASESRGAWKAVAGETYGSQKAEGWQAIAPAVDASAVTAAYVEQERIADEIALANQELGELTARSRAAARQAERVAELRVKADRLDYLKDLMERGDKELGDYEKRLVELREKAAGTPAPSSYACPDCGAVLMWQGGDLASWSHEGKTPDQEAVAALARQEPGLKVLKVQAENRRRDYNTALAASQELAGMEKDSEAPADQTALELAKTKIAALHAGKKRADAAVSELKRAVEAARTAAGKTKNAAKHHQDVAEWTAIAEACAPEGVPGEMLAEALGTINARLSEQAASAGWKQPAVNADMTITANGRPYRLLSGGEKWRVRALLAEAVSHLSGLKLLSLDEFDELDLAGRAQAMNWFCKLAGAGDIDTVLLFGTLKALPEKLPPSVTAHWLENGYVREGLAVAA